MMSDGTGKGAKILPFRSDADLFRARDVELLNSLGTRQRRGVFQSLESIARAVREAQARGLQVGDRVVVTWLSTPRLPGPSRSYSGRVVRVTRQGYHVAVDDTCSGKVQRVTFLDVRIGRASIASA